MKTNSTSFFSSICSHWVNKFFKTFFVTLTLIIFNSFRTIAQNVITISGATSVCVTGAGTVSPYLNEYEYSYDGGNYYSYAPTVTMGSTITSVNYSAKTFKVKFADFPGSGALIRVFAFDSQGNQQDEGHYSVHFNDLPTPSPPNGGVIQVCSNGQNVSVTTSQISDCNFHCRYNWLAPSGWVLQPNSGSYPGDNTLTDISPNNQPITLIAPSSNSNGYVGQLTTTARWIDCGYAENSTGYTNIYFGNPVLNPTVNGSASQSLNYTDGSAYLVVNAQEGVTGISWSITGGSGYIYPGYNSCNASFSSFVIVQASVTNGCGTTNYSFYLQKSGSFGYRVYPNPTKNSIKVEFDYKELAQQFLQKIVLLNEKNETVKAFDVDNAKTKNFFKANNIAEIDVSNLPRGKYFLHIGIGDKVNKEQIILE